MGQEHNTSARHPAGNPDQRYLSVAASCIPELHETTEDPLWIVRADANPAHPLRFQMVPIEPASSLCEKVFRAGDSFILDFTGHRAGYLSLSIEANGREPDAPVRLRLVFGEVPTDVSEPLHPYHGQLSESWLPEETITIDDIPQSVRLPRRYAFRYVKVEVIATSRDFGIQFTRVQAHAVTSAQGQVAALENAEPWMQRIDAVSIATLRSCLQTTFEDGPRRDRRLWVGDLRLQALANYVSFNQNDVVKRCLYLFAGLPRIDGLMAGCVYEKPQPRYSSIVVFDYAALFNITLVEYAEATGDLDTAEDLWPVAMKQIDILLANVDDNGLFVDPKDVWLFIDWADGLDRTASIQAVLIFCLRKSMALAHMLGHALVAEQYRLQITKMVTAAQAHFFDAVQGVYISGPDRQISWASQAWMAVAGVHATKTQGANALRKAMSTASAIKPVTPYLYHYVVEGMAACDMRQEAMGLIRHYWGGMVEAGADTFWEVYDPSQPLASPYGDIHINSYCHAWSCTPTWIFRKLLSTAETPRKVGEPLN